MDKKKELFLAFDGDTFEGGTFDKAALVKSHPAGPRLQFIPEAMAARAATMEHTLRVQANLQRVEVARAVLPVLLECLLHTDQEPYQGNLNEALQERFRLANMAFLYADAFMHVSVIPPDQLNVR